jgi:hypothetical protein
MGLPARPAPWAAISGFAYDMAIFGQKSKVVRPAKIFCEAHIRIHVTLSRDGILTNGFLSISRGTLQMRIVVSHE